MSRRKIYHIEKERGGAGLEEVRLQQHCYFNLKSRPNCPRPKGEAALESWVQHYNSLGNIS